MKAKRASTGTTKRTEDDNTNADSQLKGPTVAGKDVFNHHSMVNPYQLGQLSVILSIFELRMSRTCAAVAIANQYCKIICTCNSKNNKSGLYYLRTWQGQLHSGSETTVLLWQQLLFNWSRNPIYVCVNCENSKLTIVPLTLLEWRFQPRSFATERKLFCTINRPKHVSKYSQPTIMCSCVIWLIQKASGPFHLHSPF